MKDHPETLYIHGKAQHTEFHGSLSFPIYQTSTFSFSTAEEGERRFAGEGQGYIYSRLGNPTVQALEERIAAAEGGEKGLAFASGMAATSAILTSLTKAGSHILCSNGIYGCTYGLLSLLKEKYNITHDFSDMREPQEIANRIQPNTSCIFIETPINPTMRIIDLKMIADLAHEHNLPVVVDNTFASPYLQRPLNLGCDVVVHSATKYLNGHGDVIGGVAVGKQSFMDEVGKTVRKDGGGTMAPFDAWLLLRGLKTLHVRMERHCYNAKQIVDQLKQHKRIREVFYPTDASHPDQSIAMKQMTEGGGVVTFTIKGSKKEAMSMMNHLNLVKIAVSLGDAETLIQHPATMTHSTIPPSEREKMGVNDSMVRLSVGLEAWEDVWKDLEQALNRL
ncbi:methionine gamma-lyase [Halobacillus andaensis]|uniref:L-methionine gamma-lyase n=1 Tax=Halobacillus andaensis TaxID=1176239 RepID=A0A917B586_HALAA|nr:methionine gamma-lyase [Halobacillus andaensis]MBP2004526.1 methionine-gamma-lyase [Halobacillus andaensis]GGF20979.1 methionine gamma-lyase [Halobacillus andaensis]